MTTFFGGAGCTNWKAIHITATRTSSAGSSAAHRSRWRRVLANAWSVRITAPPRSVSADPYPVLAHRVGEHRDEPAQLVLGPQRGVVDADAKSGALLAVVDVAFDELARVGAGLVADHDPRTFGRCPHDASGA